MSGVGARPRQLASAGPSSGGLLRNLRGQDQHWSRLAVVLALVLGLLLGGSGWLLAWQTGRARSELSRERQELAGLTRKNNNLLSRREKLQAQEQIIARAAALGLYPPRPEQIRKLGTR